jgi:hypothetical protein
MFAYQALGQLQSPNKVLRHATWFLQPQQHKEENIVN